MMERDDYIWIHNRQLSIIIGVLGHFQLHQIRKDGVSHRRQAYSLYIKVSPEEIRIRSHSHSITHFIIFYKTLSVSCMIIIWGGFIASYFVSTVIIRILEMDSDVQNALYFLYKVIDRASMFN